MTGRIDFDDIVANLVEMGIDIDTATNDVYEALYGESNFDM